MSVAQTILGLEEHDEGDEESTSPLSLATILNMVRRFLLTPTGVGALLIIAGVGVKYLEDNLPDPRLQKLIDELRLIGMEKAQLIIRQKELEAGREFPDINIFRELERIRKRIAEIEARQMELEAEINEVRKQPRKYFMIDIFPFNFEAFGVKIIPKEFGEMRLADALTAAGFLAIAGPGLGEIIKGVGEMIPG